MEATSATLNHESIFKHYSILNNTFKSGGSSLSQQPLPVAPIQRGSAYIENLQAT